MLRRLRSRDHALLAIACLLVSPRHFTWPVSAENPSAIRPVVLYEFGDAGGAVQDVSGVGRPVNLRIGKPKLVVHEDHAIGLKGKSLIVSDAKPEKLVRAVKKSGEFSIEVWLTPGNLKQAGPARIVTLSTNTTNRNFTLGQDKDRFDVRLRTTRTDRNGLPSLSSPGKSASESLTHVVFTRTKDGKTRLYLDGTKVSEGTAKGTFSNWLVDAKLSLGDEVSGGRAWTGKLHRVALYAMPLSQRDVRARFSRGLESLPVAKPPSAESLAATHFEQKIAPLLAKHCLECHDVSSAKGGLGVGPKVNGVR